MKTNVASLAALLALFASPSACPGSLIYSAEAIEAWVVDAETQKPLEGVVVTANWQLIEGTFGGSIPVGQLMVMEAVSDKSGRIYFPAWGPKKAPKGHFTYDDPQLLFFKSGYEYRRLSNRVTSNRERSLEPVRKSDWHRKTIVLKRFKGTAEQYARQLGSLSNDLYPLLGSETCDWKQIPRMLLVLTLQSRSFQKLGISALYDVDVYLPVRERECGPPKVFFEAYQP